MLIAIDDVIELAGVIAAEEFLPADAEQSAGMGIEVFAGLVIVQPDDAALFFGLWARLP
jgi:hypothetical protein